jgi:hypothetical protein
MKAKLIAAAVVVSVCLGVVVTRAVWEGRSALHRGDQAHQAGDLATAVTWWRRAARWYVPGAPHVGKAYSRLEELAVAAEESGDTTMALAAWRGVRGSILATRSFFTPFEERLEPANRRIAALMASSEGEGADPGKSVAERTQWHYELLARDEAPSLAWSVLALIGFGLWLGGGVLFAVRGLRDDQLVLRSAAWAGALVAVGLVVWMLGLYNA